jgi:hypothetical protein
MKPNQYIITPELARIVAHICGDGYVYISRQRRTPKELISHPRKNLVRIKYGVRYVNTEPILIKQFTSDVKIQFGRKVVPVRKHEYDLSAKWIRDIIIKLGAGKSHEWCIVKEILLSKKAIKVEWLKSFFDDEAHVSIPDKRIVLNVVNKNGLLQIQKLLLELGIKSTVNGPYACRKYYSYNLKIYRPYLRAYYEQIGFYHPKKVRDLLALINN